MLILKDIGKVSALSSKAKVSADINTDTKVNIDDIMSILKVIGGVTKHSDLQDQFVLRDSNSSDPFSSATFDVGGGSLKPKLFLIGRCRWFLLYIRLIYLSRVYSILN